jgi:hypothetical protein
MNTKTQSARIAVTIAMTSGIIWPIAVMGELGRMQFNNRPSVATIENAEYERCSM